MGDFSEFVKEHPFLCIFAFGAGTTVLVHTVNEANKGYAARVAQSDKGQVKKMQLVSATTTGALRGLAKGVFYATHWPIHLAIRTYHAAPFGILP